MPDRKRLVPVNQKTADQIAVEALARLRSELASMRFGTVRLTVHEGRVVQMDATQRHRTI